MTAPTRSERRKRRNSRTGPARRVSPARPPSVPPAGRQPARPPRSCRPALQLARRRGPGQPGQGRRAGDGASHPAGRRATPRGRSGRGPQAGRRRPPTTSQDVSSKRWPPTPARPTCAIRSRGAPSRKSPSSSTRWPYVPACGCSTLAVGRVATPTPWAVCGLEVVGVDIAAAFLAAAAPGRPGRARWVRADARRLPFARKSFDAAISLCQGGFGLARRLRGWAGAAGRWRGRSRAGGRVAVSAFSAYFAVRHLEAGDTFDAAAGVNHERAEVRDPAGRNRQFRSLDHVLHAPGVAADGEGGGAGRHRALVGGAGAYAARPRTSNTRSSCSRLRCRIESAANGLLLPPPTTLFGGCFCPERRRRFHVRHDDHPCSAGPVRSRRPPVRARDGDLRRGG